MRVFTQLHLLEGLGQLVGISWVAGQVRVGLVELAVEQLREELRVAVAQPAGVGGQAAPARAPALAGPEQPRLLLQHPELLRAQDRPRPADADLADEPARREPEVLHRLPCDAAARAPQACFAVHPHPCFLLFGYFQKSVQYPFFRRVAVRELHVLVIDANAFEFFVIVCSVFI